MNKEERRWVWIFAVLVMIVTSIPYLLGYTFQTPEFRFSGFVFGAEDGNSYIAKMLRGASGDWLFRSPYSAYPQSGLLAFLPYLLLGKLTAEPAQHEQLVALFQMFRFFSGIILIFAIYHFAACFLQEIQHRRVATVVAALGGGLGWLALTGLQETLWGGRLPLEFYSPETFGFLGLFGLPHLALARALLLLGFSRYIRAVESGDQRRVGLAGLFWLAAGLAQPLTVATGWAILAAQLALFMLTGWIKKKLNPATFWRAARPAGVMVAISSPIIIYSLVSSLQDAYLREWTLQNIIQSPPPLDYLLAFLPLLPFALIGAKRLYRRQPFATFLLMAWVLAFPVLAYAPHNLQRRLPEGIWVALAILAAAGLAAPGRRAWRWQMAVLVSGFFPALALLLGAGLAVAKPAVPLFHPVSEVTAFRSLAGVAAKDSVVLADFGTSNRLPAWAALHTVTGHGPESVRASESEPQIQQIFQAETTQARRQQLLSELGVDYLFYGPTERALGDWNPEGDPGLQPIYRNGEYVIYSVADVNR